MVGAAPWLYPWLYINVNLAGDGGSNFAFHVGVTMKEDARVIRTGGYVSSVVWDTGGTSYCLNCGSLDARRHILSTVEELIKDFALAYLRANPKD